MKKLSKEIITQRVTDIYNEGYIPCSLKVKMNKKSDGAGGCTFESRNGVKTNTRKDADDICNNEKLEYKVKLNAKKCKAKSKLLGLFTLVPDWVFDDLIKNFAKYLRINFSNDKNKLYKQVANKYNYSIIADCMYKKEVDWENKRVNLWQKNVINNKEKILAAWTFDNILNSFKIKTINILLSYANKEVFENKKYFHYYEFNLIEIPIENVIQLIADDNIKINIRVSDNGKDGHGFEFCITPRNYRKFITLTKIFKPKPFNINLIKGDFIMNKSNEYVVETLVRLVERKIFNMGDLVDFCNLMEGGENIPESKLKRKRKTSAEYSKEYKMKRSEKFLKLVKIAQPTNGNAILLNGLTKELEGQSVSQAIGSKLGTFLMENEITIFNIDSDIRPSESYYISVEDANLIRESYK